MAVDAGEGISELMKPTPKVTSICFPDDAAWTCCELCHIPGGTKCAMK
jgi:hypothetical protein